MGITFCGFQWGSLKGPANLARISEALVARLLDACLESTPTLLQGAASGGQDLDLTHFRLSGTKGLINTITAPT